MTSPGLQDPQPQMLPEWLQLGERVAVPPPQTPPALPDCVQRIDSLLQASKTGRGDWVSWRSHCEASIATLERAMDQFSSDGLALSFNGGKDCTVLLYLFLYVRARRPDTCRGSIPTLYVCPSDPCPEESAFVDACASAYNLDVRRVTGSMKEGLASFLAACPRIRAVLVGTRRTDPFAQALEPIQRTDPGWPECFRVHPVLDWAYADVWRLLLHARLGFCSLYMRGFTSLGGRQTTRQNPRLLASSGGYLPAFWLESALHERDGRVSA